MTVEQIVLILTPLVVFGVTEFLKFILPKLSGWIIVSILVPLVSLAAAWVTSLTGVGGDFWAQTGVGLLAVFVNELIRQLRQINPVK